MCGYAVAVLVVPGTWANVPALLARVVTASAVYIGLLVATGFATTAERQRVMEVWGRARQGAQARLVRRRSKPKYPESTELAGQLMLATAGEPIEGGEPAAVTESTRGTRP